MSSKIEASTSRRVPAATTSTASTSSLMQKGKWTELLSKKYRGRTLIVWTLWASAFFIANGLNNWMPSLYNTVYHLSLRQSLRAASMTNVAQVAVLLVCAFSIDRIGRRNWTVAAFVLGGGMLALLGMMGAQKVLSVMILATLGYGLIGSINAVLISLHARNLSDPHARDWNWPGHFLAKDRLSGGAGACRFHGRCKRHPFCFLDVRRDERDRRSYRNLHGGNTGPAS